MLGGHNLLLVYLDDLFETIPEFLAHLGLQLLEALVQLDLLLHICLLPVSFCNLFVLFIACLEALMREVVPQCLHGEDWRANLTVTGYPRDGEHAGVDLATILLS